MGTFLTVVSVLSITSININKHLSLDSLVKKQHYLSFQVVSC